jgi:predicted PurR-regulated permease PerM
MKNKIFARLALFVTGLYFFFSGLYYTKGILVPLLFGSFLSMLVLPLCRRLERRINKAFAILICVLLIIGITSGMLYLLYAQVAEFMEDFPLFKAKAIDKYYSLQRFLENTFNISITSQTDWMESNYAKLIGFGGGFIKSLLLDLTGGIILFLLVTVYVFFFLLLRHRIKEFFLMIFSESHHDKVRNVFNKIEVLVLYYIRGLLIETLIIGVLNSIGFLLLGIRHAIFLGILAAVLNLIPYIGAVIGMIFPLLMAFVYKDSLWYSLGVVAVILFTHFLHAQLLTPKIVGSHIRINALATILVIVIGGVLWGIAGMILFLPLLGIIKVISDSIEELKPLGFLIGEDENGK